MTHPGNTPPQPPNPNFDPTHPDGLPVPEINQVLEKADHLRHERVLNEQIDALTQQEKLRHQFEERVRTGFYGTLNGNRDKIIAADRQRIDDLPDVRSHIEHLVFTYDTSSLLGVISGTHRRTEHHLREAADELGRANEAVDDADDGYNAHAVALRRYRIHGEPAVDTDAHPHERDDQIAARNDFRDNQGIYDITSAQASLDLQDASAEFHRTVGRLDITERLHGVLGDTFGELRARHQATLQEFDNAAREVEELLENWPIGNTEGEHPEDEARLQSHLAAMTEALSHLSSYDSARAERVEEWNRLAYRLEHRRITADTLTQGSRGDYSSLFRNDKSIIVGVGTNNQAIVYEDGSRGIAGGNTVHRINADGTPWRQPHQEEPEEGRQGVLSRVLRRERDNRSSVTTETLADEAGDALNEWESSRGVPEIETEAREAVGAYVDRLNTEVEQWAQTIVGQTNHLNELQRYIQEREAHSDHLQDSVLSDSKLPYSEHDLAQQAIDQNEEYSEQARRSILRIEQARIAAQNKLLDTREKTNVQTYWHNFLSADTQYMSATREQIHQVLESGRTMVFADSGAGRRMHLNGIDGTWVVYPDGRAVLTDELNHPQAEYLPNGQLARTF